MYPWYDFAGLWICVIEIPYLQAGLSFLSIEISTVSCLAATLAQLINQLLVSPYCVTSTLCKNLSKERGVGVCSVVCAGMYSTVTVSLLMAESTCIVGGGWGEGV